MVNVTDFEVSHSKGRELFFYVSNSPDWESIGDLQWVRGDDKIEIAVVNLDKMTAQQYKHAIEMYGMEACIYVWDYKPESFEELVDWIKGEVK